jgi:glycosyltransferase involved in cell wall biosynthesis
VKPKVSVVLPVYNSEHTISKSIDSVLTQTYDNIELLIIDDGSTDNSREIINTYDDSRINLITHQYNRGGSAARNSGIYYSTGEYISFLDSDDSWDAEKTEKQITHLESLSEEWIASYCDSKFIPEQTNSQLRKYLRRIDDQIRNWHSENLNENNQSIPDEGGTELIKHILGLQFGTGGSSTVIVKTDIVKQIHGFDPKFQRHQDWEFLIRVLEQGKIAHLNECLVNKYTGGNADSETIATAKRLYFEKYDDYISEFDDEVDITRDHYFRLGLQHLRDQRRLKGMWHILNNLNGIDKEDGINIITALGESYAQNFY